MNDNIQIKIPLNWELISIKESINKYPLTGKKLNQKEYEKEGLFPVIDQGQSYIGGYSNKEDLIISSENPFIIFGDHTLKIKFINFDFIAGADGVKVFQAKKFFYPKLFYYFSQAVKFPHKGYARHFQFFEKAEIPLPPLAEQHRIVEKIEEEFTRLDAGVSALKRAKALIPKYRQSVLKAAMCGDLTKEWRALHPDVESAEVLVEKISIIKKSLSTKKTNEPKKDNSTDQPYNVPSNWTWSKLNEICEIKGGITKDSKKTFSNSKCLPYLRVANVQRGYLDLSEIKSIQVPEDKINDFLLEKDDILFTEGGDRDKLGRGWIWNNEISQMTFQNHIFRARKYLPEMESKFISWYGNANGKDYFAKKGKQTTNLASINMTQLKGLPVPLPPLEEQHEIVSEIERRFSIIDEMERVVDESLIKAERLRQSVLKCAFEGRLVLQNPDDEPAGVLLERIKAEKELRAAEGKANGKKKSAGKKKAKKAEAE